MIKVLVLDGDGTSWKYPYGKFESSWHAVSVALGVEEEVNKLLSKYYDNREMHEEWAVQQTALFKGKRVKDAERIIYPVPYTSGLRELMAATKGRCLRGILTTGIHLVAEKAAEDMNLDFCFCNSLHTKEGFFTGTLSYDVPLWGKHLILEEFCRKRKINPQEVCYFGDSENDVLCMKLAGLSVAVDPKDKAARAVAMHTVNDFVEVKKILNGKVE